ncbi:membrane frizzled-related protein [Sarcophilus harrisii]|uniref:membrane frizzled-related protein n=1 Tax=Sarcophilus harrisii TaxID=9305 RepID=UPI001301AC97|nr:membrane frizzled-related protein [Sarcophilus harrisii]
MKDYTDIALCADTAKWRKPEFCNPAFEPEAGLSTLSPTHQENGSSPRAHCHGNSGLAWRYQTDRQFSWLCAALLSTLLFLLLGLLTIIILTQLKPTSPPGTSPSLLSPQEFSNTTDIIRPGIQGELATDLTPEPTCGGLLLDLEGSFTSPNYPDPYPPDAYCIWHIQVVPDQVVQLKIEAFSMDDVASCLFDWLEISLEPEEQENPESPMVRVCGKVPPVILNTNASRLRVLFVSDRSVGGIGFRAWYQAVTPREGGCNEDKFPCDHLFCLQSDAVCDGFTNCQDASDETNCSSKDSDCGGSLNELHGTFSTPNYPKPYPHQQFCLWQISVPPGHGIELRFHNFSLEAHQDCEFDYVEIHENTDTGALNLMGRFCGPKLPPPLVSSHHELTVVFVTDYQISSMGFSATYQALNSTDNPCGFGELSCQDGVCKDFDRVCDSWRNCSDGSDKANCSSLSHLPFGEDVEPACEPIQVEMCQGLSYNTTAFPNTLMTLDSQQEVEEMLKGYKTLTDLPCYQPFRRLLCGLLLPHCTPSGGILPPCRPVCLEAEQYCQPDLEPLGISWSFDCKSLPDTSDPAGCTWP